MIAKWLKYKSDSTGFTLLKEKLLINFISITSIFSIFYVLISVIIGYKPGVIVMLINFALFLINLLLFLKKAISYKAAANLYVGNCAFVAILFCTYFSGGLFSPVLPWFILIPTISLLLFGISITTWIWLSFDIVIIIAFGLLSISGYKCPVKYDTSWANFFTITCIAGLALIVYIVTMVFEKAKERALSKLAEKNKEITDSIVYAQRIQNSLLAPKELIEKYLPESFVFFKPKDIVSGDFYWATEKNNNLYFAVCDCTGHGVPGAFVSLLISNFLYEAINDNTILEPHKIFDYVRFKVIEYISKDGGKDGMDGIIIRYNKSMNKITYASANNSSILIKNNEVIKLAKDKMPVGIGERNSPFSLFTINTSPGDMLYLYSDGFADLFGGPKGKKFTYRQLNENLNNITHLSIEKQRSVLEEIFYEWKGEIEQVDDVCLVGIRL